MTRSAVYRKTIILSFPGIPHQPNYTLYISSFFFSIISNSPNCKSLSSPHFLVSQKTRQLLLLEMWACSSRNMKRKIRRDRLVDSSVNQTWIIDWTSNLLQLDIFRAIFWSQLPQGKLGDRSLPIFSIISFAPQLQILIKNNISPSISQLLSKITSPLETGWNIATLEKEGWWGGWAALNNWRITQLRTLRPLPVHLITVQFVEIRK